MTSEFGPFRLVRRLAVGGTSEVFLAEVRDASVGLPMHEPLVIKRLLPTLLQDVYALQTFEMEAKLHRAIVHPNVVEVLGSGVVDGEPYLAMKYIPGVDLYRLGRRARAEGRKIPVHLVAYIGASVADALDATFRATDETGARVVVAHRDVTPSNIYLSTEGHVFLGDFGIAKAWATRASRSSLQAGLIQGKYAYLAPEQVAGQPADHRSDIFSLGVVLAELLLGRPLFEGYGQLAVLLAIRDANVDAIDDIAEAPAALKHLLREMLARDPADRLNSAAALRDRLALFAQEPDRCMRELGEWVRWAEDMTGMADRIKGALLQSARFAARTQPGEVPPTKRRVAVDEAPTIFEEAEPSTRRFDERPSRVRLASGRELGEVPFAQIVAQIATGAIGPDDEVSLFGAPYQKVRDIELLARHLLDEKTTKTVGAPTAPDLAFRLSERTLLEILGKLSSDGETGFLLLIGPETHGSPRREVYLKGGLLHHVAASDTSELLGQMLVRRGLLTTEELDMALAVLPRHGGRLGDTLVSLGVVDPVELFRAIAEQGRERLAGAFAWKDGTAMFYRGVLPKHVEFPLAEDIVHVLLVGAEVAFPGDAPIERWRPKLDYVMRTTKWTVKRQLPAKVNLVLDALGSGLTVKHLLLRLGTSGQLDAPTALRVLDVALVLGLAEA